jgi:hypothetical protein
VFRDFLDTFSRTGKSKMEIHAVVNADKGIAVKFEGSFALVK